MSMLLTVEERGFADRIRAFIRENLDPATATLIRRGDHVPKEGRVAWEQALGRKGWLAYTWPKENGGPGWSVREQFIFDHICAEMDTSPITPFGIKMVGPVLLKYGDEAQKCQHLPGILASTVWWCQGYSEPGAGSDLAALSTRADRDGDHYIVNGQKIWTSTAHWADWMFALVRTSREDRRQDGISFLLIDMRTPGITVRPIIAMDGHHGFNEVFFTDVRVPAANRIGEEGKGWTYAKYLLSHERLEVVGLNQIAQDMRRLRHAALSGHEGGPRAWDDPDFRSRIADLEVRLRALEAGVLEALGEMMRGGSPGPTVSMLKIRGTELNQDVAELMMDAIGAHALPYAFADVGSPPRALAPPPGHAETVSAIYMYRRAWTILGGSTEIQKNIMSKAVLELGR